MLLDRHADACGAGRPPRHEQPGPQPDHREPRPAARPRGRRLRVGEVDRSCTPARRGAGRDGHRPVAGHAPPTALRDCGSPGEIAGVAPPLVVTGSAAAGVAGAWQGLLGSYVPAVLGAAGHAAGVVGVLVALANAANTASSAALTRVRVRSAPATLATSCLAVALGVGLLGLAGRSGAAAGACLVISGLGAGVLQVLGYSVASESVHREERGQAIAMTGTVRAAAMFGSPLAVSGLLQVAGIAAALGVVGLALLLPIARLGRRGR
ncbi:MFS transporter [Blastococcus brunescens]|uniref:MFS transporter n=1 Tax=Blastococcus brunescens TaxID=1564165 RepID=A0ABZ1AYL9_9ACTN|nr:MFS transporter [Blastococcus sp. BMG 8361]WRL63620.1 MFS transporter [Blastococcus sp. BMG 8361]